METQGNQRVLELFGGLFSSPFGVHFEPNSGFNFDTNPVPLVDTFFVRFLYFGVPFCVISFFSASNCGFIRQIKNPPALR